MGAFSSQIHVRMCRAVPPPFFFHPSKKSRYFHHSQNQTKLTRDSLDKALLAFVVQGVSTFVDTSAEDTMQQLRVCRHAQDLPLVRTHRRPQQWVKKCTNWTGAKGSSRLYSPAVDGTTATANNPQFSGLWSVAALIAVATSLRFLGPAGRSFFSHCCGLRCVRTSSRSERVDTRAAATSY